MHTYTHTIFSVASRFKCHNWVNLCRRHRGLHWGEYDYPVNQEIQTYSLHLATTRHLKSTEILHLPVILSTVMLTLAITFK